MFEETLGYDPLGDITRESPIHDKFVDIALKIDGSIRLLVEVKSAGTKLRDHHIDQAQHYGAEGNIPWVVLTNGVVWNLYHLTFDEGVEYVRAFSIDLGLDPIDKAADQLALLHKHSIMKAELEDYWQKRSARGPSRSVGQSSPKTRLRSFARRSATTRTSLSTRKTLPRRSTRCFRERHGTSFR